MLAEKKVGIVVKVKKWVVSAKDAGRLSQFLALRYPRLSSNAIKRALEQRSCEVNGAIERFASRMLEPGDEVVFHAEQLDDLSMIEVLASTEEWIAIAKPAGFICAPESLKDLIVDQGPLWLVHRLDRETTGVLLLARSQPACKSLQAQFANRSVKKEYLAIIDGAPKTESGEISKTLVKSGWFHGQQLWKVSDIGVEAHTSWEMVTRSDKASLVRCFPKTGRTHQIRVHLSHIAHPILGDRQYSSRFRCSARTSRIMLHHSRFEFDDPTTGERISLQVALPQDMRDLIDTLFREIPMEKEGVWV